MCVEQGRVSTRDIVLQLWSMLLKLQSNDGAAGLSLRGLTGCVWPVGSLALQSPRTAGEVWVLQVWVWPWQEGGVCPGLH